MKNITAVVVAASVMLSVIVVRFMRPMRVITSSAPTAPTAPAAEGDTRPE
jgi:hypothetical protein